MDVYFPPWVYRQRTADLARTIRDALIFMLIIHAALTVITAPRWRR